MDAQGCGKRGPGKQVLPAAMRCEKLVPGSKYPGIGAICGSFKLAHGTIGGGQHQGGTGLAGEILSIGSRRALDPGGWSEARPKHLLLQSVQEYPRLETFDREIVPERNQPTIPGKQGGRFPCMKAALPLAPIKFGLQGRNCVVRGQEHDRARIGEEFQHIMRIQSALHACFVYNAAVHLLFAMEKKILLLSAQNGMA